MRAANLLPDPESRGKASPPLGQCVPIISRGDPVTVRVLETGENSDMSPDEMGVEPEMKTGVWSLFERSVAVPMEDLEFTLDAIGPLPLVTVLAESAPSPG